MKHLLGAPLYGKLLALPILIRLGWKGLAGTNGPAYCEHSYTVCVKCFISLKDWVKLYSVIFGVIYTLEKDLKIIGSILSSNRLQIKDKTLPNHKNKPSN